VINKSKPLSVNDYTFLKTIGKVSFSPSLPLLILWRAPLLRSNFRQRQCLTKDKRNIRLTHCMNRSLFLRLARLTHSLLASPFLVHRFAIKIIKKNCFRDRTRSMKYKPRGNQTQSATTVGTASSSLCCQSHRVLVVL
jgi:hypothetical protein